MRVQITRFQTSFIRLNFLIFLNVLVRTCVVSHISAIAIGDDGGGGGGGCGDSFYRYANKIKSEYAYIIRKYVPQRLERINRLRLICSSVCL